MTQKYNRLLLLAISLASTIAPAPTVLAENLTAEEYYRRGHTENTNGAYSQALADYNSAIKLKPDYWKAYANRSAARFNCHDYQGALQDINIGMAHLPPAQSLTDLKALIERTIASQSSQAQNMDERRAAVARAQRMLLNAQLGIGSDMSSPAYQIMQMADNIRARGGTIPKLVNTIPNDLVVSGKGPLVHPIGGSSAPVSTGKSASPFTATSGNRTADVTTPDAGSSSSPFTTSSASPATSSLPIGSSNPFAAATSNSKKVEIASATPTQNHSSSADAQMTAQQYFDRACEKGKTNDLVGAIKDYDQCIRLNPNHGPAYANRGSARFNSGDREGALEDFNKAVSLMPDNPGVKDLRDQIEKALALIKGMPSQ